MMFEVDEHALLVRLAWAAAEILLLLAIILATLMIILLMIEWQREQQSLTTAQTPEDPESQTQKEPKMTEDQTKRLKPEGASSEGKEPK